MTLRLSDIEGSRVLGEADAELGTVERVLFHPTQPRVIGVMVDPPALAGVVKRGPRYAPLADIALSSGVVRFAGRKLAVDEMLVEGPDGTPHRTVAWTGMGVVGPSGTESGRVADAVIDAGDGRVVEIELTGGGTADAAYGSLTVPVEAVLGYRDGALRIDRDFSDLEASGGIAKSAAELSVRIERSAGSVVSATGAVAGKVARRTKKTWRDAAAAFREGYEGDDS